HAASATHATAIMATLDMTWNRWLSDMRSSLGERSERSVLHGPTRPGEDIGTRGGTLVRARGAARLCSAPQSGEGEARHRASGKENGLVGTEWTFGSVLWVMIEFFFIFLLIWMFIAVFADIFRRNDLSGWGKAGWILLIFIVPLIGILIYVIARPKMTEQDKEMMMQAQEAQRRVEGYSAADEV